MKTVLIGSVGSSRVCLEQMLEVGFPLDMVFSLDERYSTDVSGYYPLHELAEANRLPYRKFRRINDEANVSAIKQINPDYIFVIGLSQLVSKDIMQAAGKGVIGFHPTPLPKLRGRAAQVWQVLLGIKDTKCTLFFIDEGIDSGDIIDQEPYVILDTDYASDVSQKCLHALARLLQRSLPNIMSGIFEAKKQNEEEATYLLKRVMEDGFIDWSQPVEKIQRLVRAVSKPYPGAFSLYDGVHKIIIWRADYMANNKYIGIPGQIAWITDDYFDVVCVDGLLRVFQHENVGGVKLVVGHKFK